MNAIEIRIVPHCQQRYETCGDWVYGLKHLAIKVSDLGDERMNACLAVHELVEALLCRAAGIKQEAVDAFDIWYGSEYPDGEPGDHPSAPYRKQHFIATTIERIFAEAIGVDWNEYDKAINAL
jgi:hypothetical protein